MHTNLKQLYSPLKSRYLAKERVKVFSSASSPVLDIKFDLHLHLKSYIF